MRGKGVQMDFITLEKTIDGIAGRINLPEEYSQYADLDHVYKTSEAAANLHQRLHNLPELRPKWVVLHPVTERPVFDDTVADAGMEILMALAGEFRREIGHDNSVPSLEITRRKFPIPPMEKRPHDKKHRNPFKSPGTEIGFDRYELVCFLNDPRVGIAHAVRGGVVVEQGERPLSQHHQEQDGIRVIEGAPDTAGKGEARAVKRTAPKLALPDKSDIWAKAIKATYEILIQETGGTPSGVEVWLRMNDKPPANYPIKVTKDHGLAAIAMSGEKLLTRDGFMKRWRRYTTAK
jgi:hypothetical protein